MIRVRLTWVQKMDYWSTPLRWTDDPDLPRVSCAALEEFLADEQGPEDAEEVWYVQKACEAQWAVEKGGDIYAELDVPRTTATSDMKWLLREYIRQFHGDKKESWNMTEAEKDGWTWHAGRIGNFKSYFENEVLR